MVDCSTVPSSVSENSSLYDIATNSTLLQGCAYEVCNAIHNLKLCSGCHDTWYCSEDHQRKHWRRHRRNCKVKMTDQKDKKDQTETRTAPFASVNQPSYPNPVVTSRPPRYNVRPEVGTFTSDVFSTSVSNSNSASISNRPSTACGPDQASAILSRRATEGDNNSQISADVRSTTSQSGNVEPANEARARQMTHLTSLHDGVFPQNQTVFTAPRGVHYLTSNMVESRSHGTRPVSNSMPPPEIQERTMPYQQYLPPSTLSTPFVVPYNTKDNSDYQVNKSDPFVEQDTDQFSENIRRSSSYPLSPLNSVDANSITTSGSEGVDVNDRREQSIIQPKSCSFMLGDESPSCSVIEGSSSVGTRELPAVASGNLQPQSKNSLTDYVTQWMQTYGICVLDKFLSEERGLKILDEMKSLYRRGDFMAGQLVRGREDGSSKEIRGDLITWSDGTEPNCSNIGHLISTMDSIVMGCQGKLSGCKVSGRTKAMLACYPGNGTRYVRHVDNPSGDGRRITCIYYLNKNWNSRENGGLLRIYPVGQNIVANIEPLFNRLLLFWSDRRNPHEVFPAYATRYAVTVWYFDLEERIKAKIQT